MSGNEAAAAALKKKSNNSFLLSLFKLNKNNRKKRKTLIDEATEAQIRVLLKVMRLVWSGQIPLKDASHLKAIRKSGKVDHISKHFLHQDRYHALKGKSLNEQKAVLKEISTWHELLYRIFKKTRTQ